MPEEEEKDGIGEFGDETGELNRYRCVKCEQEVNIDPVEEKIICPKCSHRVLLKARPENPKHVEAV
jgi:DNA-directed RNA polymerase subunit RPC12/RpoP